MDDIVFIAIIIVVCSIAIVVPLWVLDKLKNKKRLEKQHRDGPGWWSF